MRTFFFIISLLLFGNVSLGQSQREHQNNKKRALEYHRIYIGMDTVFAQDGSPYCILKKVGYNYSVRNLLNEELIIIKRETYQGLDDALQGIITGYSYDTRYYDFIFLPLQVHAETKGDFWYGTFKVAEILVNSGLIKNNALDENAVNSFVRAYGVSFSEERAGNDLANIVNGNKPASSAPSPSVNIGGLVERNKNATVILEGDKIMQEGKVIGFFTQTSGLSMSGEKVSTIIFYTTDKKSIGEASTTDSQSGKWTIQSNSGNLNTEIETEKGLEALQLARIFILEGYL